MKIKWQLLDEKNGELICVKFPVHLDVKKVAIISAPKPVGLIEAFKRYINALMNR